MKVDLKLDKKYKEPLILIYTDTLSKEVTGLIEYIENPRKTNIMGIKNEKYFILSPDEVYLFSASEGKVYIKTAGDEYLIRNRIYELENTLPENFVRISNSEIVNFDKVKHLDMSISGTINLSFNNETNTFVSRRYIKKIKEYLNI